MFSAVDLLMSVEQAKRIEAAAAAAGMTVHQYLAVKVDELTRGPHDAAQALPSGNQTAVKTDAEVHT